MGKAETKQIEIMVSRDDTMKFRYVGIYLPYCVASQSKRLHIRCHKNLQCLISELMLEEWLVDIQEINKESKRIEIHGDEWWIGNGIQ